MKWIYLLFLFSLPLVGKAQVRANKIIIEVEGFKVQNFYILHQQPPMQDEVLIDTISALYSLYADSDVVVKDTFISIKLSGRSLYNGIGPSVIDWSYNIDIELDTVLRVIKNLNYNSSQKWYYNYPPDDYYFWSDPIKGLSLKSVSYHISKTKDTLSIYLDTSTLRNSLFEVSNYALDATRHTYSQLTNSNLLKIEDNAYISVKIIGSFPLGVNTTSQAKSDFFSIYPSSRTIKLLAQTIKQNQPLPCYDILGRKYNLEFLGSDENSSTYSVRSLRAGVYFVNDGKETSKFMIAE